MWEPTHQERAQAEGWKLVTTIDSGDDHPMWDIVPHGGTFPDARAASLAVIDAAKRGGPLHQHALKLVTSSRMRSTKPTKGKT